MTLQTGARLGPYEILARVGAGGMGEVFRARDTRLDRTVAVKILPATHAASAQLRLRFEREAKAISALNHPHICSLYDVGCDSGIDYLVMENSSKARRWPTGSSPLASVLVPVTTTDTAVHFGRATDLAIPMKNIYGMASIDAKRFVYVTLEETREEQAIGIITPGQ